MLRSEINFAYYDSLLFFNLVRLWARCNETARKYYNQGWKVNLQIVTLSLSVNWLSIKNFLSDLQGPEVWYVEAGFVFHVLQMYVKRWHSQTTLLVYNRPTYSACVIWYTKLYRNSVVLGLAIKGLRAFLSDGINKCYKNYHPETGLSTSKLLNRYFRNVIKVTLTWKICNGDGGKTHEIWTTCTNHCPQFLPPGN
jgi:hypothetical protein